MCHQPLFIAIDDKLVNSVRLRLLVFPTEESEQIMGALVKVSVAVSKTGRVISTKPLQFNLAAQLMTKLYSGGGIFTAVKQSSFSLSHCSSVDDLLKPEGWTEGNEGLTPYTYTFAEQTGDTERAFARLLNSARKYS